MSTSMGYQRGRDAVRGYVWLDDPSLTLSAGPSNSREATDDDLPYAPPVIRLGFAPPPVSDPFTWEGDGA